MAVEPNGQRFRGTVTYFHPLAMYGFVQRDDGGEVYYLPASAVKSAGLQALKIGNELEFAGLPPGGNPRAVNLKLIAANRR
jgi:cold shock CspA family protein